MVSFYPGSPPESRSQGREPLTLRLEPSHNRMIGKALLNMLEMSNGYPPCAPGYALYSLLFHGPGCHVG